MGKVLDEGSLPGTDGRENGILPKSLECYQGQDTLLGTLTTTPRAGSPPAAAEWQAQGREGFSGPVHETQSSVCALGTCVVSQHWNSAPLVPACSAHSQQWHSSQQAPPVPGRSSVFGEKVETVMMQRLNDKGQSVAPPPREVSRSAKSTWTGTRAVAPGCAGTGPIHTTALGGTVG